MRKNILIGIFILLSFVGRSQDLLRVKSNLDSLCSPEFAGRGYVNNGDKKAAEFISRQFEKLGLNSFNKGSYFQNFSFPINTFPGEVSLSLDGKEQELGVDFILSAGSSSASGKASVCILDTLIFTDSMAVTRFLKVRAKNAVMVYRQKDLSLLSKLSSKCREKFASFHQYIELVDQKLTASVSPIQNEKPTFQLLQKSFPRGVKSAGFRIESQFIPNYASQNVIGFVPGKENADSIIVITAHYDHLGKMGKIFFPGANDNASGITMLLELADYYKKNPPSFSIAFIAFAGEEAGLLGSRYFTENPVFPLRNIKFLLNLDMVGTGDDGITVVNGAIHGREYEILNAINEEKKYLSLIKKRGEAANSDHYFFHKKGVKSFFIYALGGTAAYHDINDKPESLPLTKYKEIFHLLTEFLEKI